MNTARAGFRILVVDDEPEIVRDLVDLLGDEGYVVTGETSGARALERALVEELDLVLCDLRLPPPDGMEIVRRLSAARPMLPVIILTAHADPGLALQAMRAGAADYVVKPWNTFELLLRVRRIHERWDLLIRQERLTRWLEELTGGGAGVAGLEELVGRSTSMRQVFGLARRVADSEATILLRGESGTGKTVLAGAIHRLGARSQGPFLKLNCGAIPEHLLESELFGHEKGAFTGAIRRKPGLFEVAEGGTLLLDEVGDLSAPVQVKLLQAIEERTFLRVGGVDLIRVDVRLIAATHRDLEEAIHRGEFREDLFYRLNVFPIVLPPLRERREDIPLLVEHFLRRTATDPARLTEEALRLLTGHDWPGNIRELENLLERAMILGGEGPLQAEHFPTLIRRSTLELPAPPEIPEDGVSLEEIEKAYILAALRKTGGNKTRAAQLLGMTRRTLYSRLDHHGIPA